MITRRGYPYLAAVGIFLLVVLYQSYPKRSDAALNKFFRPQSKPTGPYPHYEPGVPKPPGSSYTRTLVIGKLESEDTSWIETNRVNINSTSIYVVDNPDLSEPLRVLANKGHEAMVYLTYIIDYYDSLADTTIFMHPHLTTWHNNDLLNSSALETLDRLSDEHVARAGYFNIRCHHEPGCPDWLHPDRPEDELDTFLKMEEKSFSLAVWNELHPGWPAPTAISQPCCAQFAVSRERIRANPKSEYIRYREWLLNTELDDSMSGRVMEYTWQTIFTGQAEFCPAMNVCYCDGYGVCFGGAAEFEKWFDLRTESRSLRSSADAMAGEAEFEGSAKEMRVRVSTLEMEMENLKQAAFERGKDPRARAEECGRPWTEGDGF